MTVFEGLIKRALEVSNVDSKSAMEPAIIEA
ncbi:hypothetical protein Asulf_01427 [Archaeoglobus sulfaticallidus PM70-1]|uniref:Uncharacterized protein n=1 Tax=Archaeoglobus sulfaticallidus PM70-1 TaxID=387631 RepID=N0BCS5_9EURY|nr:hypothetical protein Asulf_01427 [Archaeoglobus sulfaticallidus PM70-1]